MRRTATVIAQHWPLMDRCSGFHFHFLSLFFSWFSVTLFTRPSYRFYRSLSVSPSRDFFGFLQLFHFSFYHTFAGNTSSEPLMMDCCSAAEKCWICLKIVRKGQKSWCQIICLPTENPCSTEVLSPLLSQWSSSWLETSQLSQHQYNIWFLKINPQPHAYPGYIRLLIGKGKETRGLEEEAREERQERVEKIFIKIYIYKKYR